MLKNYKIQFFLWNSSEWVANIGVIMKATNKSVTGKKYERNREWYFFYFLTRSLTTFKLKYLEKILTVPKTLSSKKTLGQDLSISPSPD
jgi:hypothetical protein